MVSRRYYLNISVRIILMMVTCILFALAVFRLPNPSILTLLGLLIPIQAYFLIRYLNSINRKLEQFFIMHLSGDVTTSFTGSGRKDEFEGLYSYFRRVNDKLESSRVESEIRNNYFKTIVDHTSTGLISFTMEGRVELFNDAARKIFRINVLRTLEKLDLFKEGFSDTLKALKPGESQLINLIIDDDLLQLSTRKAIFRTGTIDLHLVSFQNIKSELEQQEIESWQKLIRVLTHEIMNSITPIITLVATLTRIFRHKETGILKSLGELTDQNLEKTMRGLDIIENRGNGLVHFVRNYRSVAILPKPEFQILNLNDMFTRINELHEDILKEKNIMVTIECPHSLHLQADGKLIDQVLINLFKNAIEAVNGILVPRIRMTAENTDNQVVIEVEDNGAGITDYAMQHIFVPFFTTKEGGSGIGLSLSKQIIRLHGGTISVQSSPGKTVFTIKI
ncbi:MAG: ATP-binding protein [Bacteroidetes bacterium]|nr:ATP-binding protein [Bacteroidota bacterium]